MVANMLTMSTPVRLAILASALVVGTAHAATPHSATAQAAARVAILRPLALRITAQSSRLELAPERREPIVARKVERPCGIDLPGRCVLIVYDLP